MTAVLQILLGFLHVAKGDILPVCYNASNNYLSHHNFGCHYGDYNPEAVLQGPLYQLGNFDDCVYKKKSQYCLSKIQLFPDSNPSSFWCQIEKQTEGRTHFRRDLIYLGLCVPESYTAKDVEMSASNMIKPAAAALGVHAVVNVEPKSCQNRAPSSVTMADVIVGGIVFIIIALVTKGTLYDAGLIKGKEENGNEAQEFLLCFSLIANWKKLFSVRRSEVLACIQGIRSILACLEITVHSVYFTLISATTNLEWFEKHYSSSSALLLIDCPIHMVTYLCIGGFLLGYTTRQKMEGKQYTLCNFSHMIGHRFLRLSPISILLSLLSATWLNHIGSGPLWPSIIGEEVENCRNHWWINLLYLNNYIYADRPCLLHTWYLATDFQNYIVSLLILMIANIYQAWTIIIFGSVLIFWISVPFIQTYIDRLDPALFILPETIRHLPTNEMYLKNYISFHHNAAPYFVGVLFGYYFYHIKTQQNVVSKEFEATTWILSLTVPWSLLLINHNFYAPGYEYNVNTASAYAALQKTMFAIGIGCIVLGCCAGTGRIFNRFLSWTPFQIFGSLTYCMYLSHFILQRIASGSLKEPVTCSSYHMISKALTDFIAAVISGLILCLFVEMPMSNVFQLKFFSGCSKCNAEKSKAALNCKSSRTSNKEN